MRLINWHYFQDETFEFGNQTLISGKNGAGKSTIIDALQYIIIGNQKQIRFNTAAHDEAKRTLINYLKGKIGSDERSYLREGDFTSYILSEFRDDAKKESFVLGVVVDVYKDFSYDEEFFILANKKIDSLELVTNNGFLRNRDQFKRLYNIPGNMSIFERNKTNYQKAVLNRFGQLHERFFSVFTRGLYFKPIQSVRDYVYDNILDKRELQLDVMKENFEIHEKYRLELEELEKRREKLFAIRNSYGNYCRYRDTVNEQEYVIRSLNYVYEQEVLEQHQQELQMLKSKYENIIRSIELADIKKDESNSEKEIAYRTWQDHQAEKIKQELEKDIDQLLMDQQKLKQNIGILSRIIKDEHKLLSELHDWKGNSLWQLSNEEVRLLNNSKQIMAHISNIFDKRQLLRGAEIDNIKTNLQATSNFLRDKYYSMLVTSSKIDEQILDIDKLVKEIEEVIENLKQKKRPYPLAVQTLKKRLAEKLGESTKVYIFCEEMEVANEEWRNAIEGYLSTQRFDILVEPESFIKALAIYEKDKWKYKIEGVGLVDTDKERKYLNSAKDNSLAKEIVADNLIIKAHLEHLLGHVMLAYDEQDLRKYNTAVTKSCMVYNRLVARQMLSDRYAVPYIGAHAIARQLEIKELELNQAKKQLEELRTINYDIKGWIRKLKDSQSKYDNIMQNIMLSNELNSCIKMLDNSKERLSLLDLNEVNRLKANYEKWIEIEKEWDQKRILLEGDKRANEKDKQHKSAAINLQENIVKEKFQRLAEWDNLHGVNHKQSALKRWNDAEKQDILTYHKITNWTNNQKGFIKRRDDEYEKVQDLRRDYNREYNFQSSDSLDNNVAYDEYLNEIENVNIPEYQNKIKLALENSEDEFKSHFIFKLKEAIQMAKHEFENLNYALRSFPFDEERYHFEITASTKYKRFYEAIMDPMLVERGSLFDIEDAERSQVLHELFDVLVSGKDGEMDEFTDYRRYLEFDIRITFSDGSRQSFSQLLQEKSGGETQTPFYIATLASFYQLYNSNKAVKLIIFDEAFNKMDEERIQTSLRLIKQLGLQLVAAVPDEKMQHMIPEVTTTLIVSKHNYSCFVDMVDRNEFEETSI